jgi:putative copper export protein
VERCRRRRSPAEGIGEVHGEGRALTDFSSLLEHAGGAGAVLARAVSFAGTAGVIGSVIFRRVVVPAGTQTERLSETARRVGYAAAVLILATVPYRLISQAKGLAFEGDPWTPMVSRILSTDWGHAAVWQGAAAFIAAAGFLMAGRGKAHGWIHASVAAVILAIVPAFMGHAIATQPPTWSVAADVVHVAAAGAWAGGLSVLAITAMRLRHEPEGGATLATLIERFHVVAKRSVGMVIVSGVVSSVFHLRAIGDLLDTPYGLTLVQKLVLVGIALLLGWGHSRTGATRSRTRGTRGVSASLMAEFGMLVAVLLVTGLLTGSPPPGAE